MIRRWMARWADVTGEIARLRRQLRHTERACKRAIGQAATAAKITGDAEVRAAQLDRQLAEIAGILYAAQGTAEEREEQIKETLRQEGRHRA